MKKKISYLFLYKLPLTKIKLTLAFILYRIVKIFVKSRFVNVQRKGINYQLDLSEGIDLSIFLFGNFQNHITKNRYYSLPENSTIIDIGANIGNMTLSFAKAVQNCQVYAIEPTDYGFEKLINNLSLNPSLKKKVIPLKLFISDTTKKKSNMQIFSSWKIDKKHNKRHPVHGGIEKSVTNVECITLDKFCSTKKIEKIDLIKIDTDGHEFSILNGGNEVFQQIKPVVIFETGQYIMKEFNVQFSDYLNFFKQKNYRLFSLQQNTEITADNYKAVIPELSTIDIIALPVA